MPVAANIADNTAGVSRAETLCYHCGTPCIRGGISYEQKAFCCDGCKLVYEIQEHPGLTKIKALRNDKFAYLDEAAIAQQLYSFTDGKQAMVTLQVPGIHCSSCMWLLEHLYKINPGIIDSRINFSAKEVTIRFRQQDISLRQVAELLATIGYEPLISLESGAEKKTKTDKSRIYKLGIAGFCFGNIMMMSFPEYLSSNGSLEHEYAMLFRILNLLLSIPVVFYAASEFFVNAWAGIKQRILNIDAPIVLAIIITYSRSLYEIFTGVGNGYLDSISGIVFFMLVGRVVQERTYRSLSFHRDYKAYFPMAATVLAEGKLISKQITQLEQHDVVQVYHQELIPADGILVSGDAYIDYSFVTGENEPVKLTVGEKIFAGGRQTGELLQMEVIKPVTASYLTSLWNNKSFSNNKAEQNDKDSFIHILSKYFSIILFSLAACTAVYWWQHDASMILPSVSAMLIVACPCALLLTATYTNGNLLRILSDNGLYLRDANVIEQMGDVSHIVFDKTGTLTEPATTYDMHGAQLTTKEKQLLYSAVSVSNHPKSRQLAAFLGEQKLVKPDSWQEHTGKGIGAVINGTHLQIGSAEWLGIKDAHTADVYAKIGDKLAGFHTTPQLRTGAGTTLNELKKSYNISLLSGDHNRHQSAFAPFFENEDMYFSQQPADKLNFIAGLQQMDRKVAMIGDGLNDAGALQQSNVGITLADDINNFSPACDAILKAEQLPQLPALFKLAKYGRRIIYAAFIISIIYNIIGISISMRGEMNPMIAAILMPLSTLTIVLVTTGVANIAAARLGLKWKEN
jgi:Cu+-exporting ATPase